MMKCEKKQELNVLYQVSVFSGANRKIKMATSASDWLRNFLLLWNRQKEFNEISQQPLPILCFSDQPRWPICHQKLNIVLRCMMCDT